MRIGDVVYCSPGHKFIDLKWDDKENLLTAFRDRVEGFYLVPAQQLNDAKQAFASGVICVSTIDFLARIQIGEERVGQRIEKWMANNLPMFAKTDPENHSRNLARRFYDEFRNGLVHEGRIKNGGQFSYDRRNIVETPRPVMIVNPRLLADGISDSFAKYLEIVAVDEFTFQSFRCALISCFQVDLEIARM